ncbi:hypothetical protein LSTR_LSTR007155 [Laodelphax striatellus]|uniref:peptidyl-tRNA hydrolase n=1 Tax=Laodelphax striatellus TaxID=195883 RepID=A0A482WWB6_LAOST|nr:hypothetical protein LSTR_LSTR007155 [Laodelphax striatellus]
MASPIIQYVLLRKDLQKKYKYSMGTVIAQVCQACLAANERFKTKPETVQYLKNYQSMPRVILQVDDEKALQQAEELLKSNNLDYHVWVEHPEVQTSIALRPYSESNVEEYMICFKLYK